jgi:hypothetical protein
MTDPSPFANGWGIAFALASGFLAFLISATANQRELRQIQIAALAFMLVAGVYLVHAGAELAFAWTNLYPRFSDVIRNPIDALSSMISAIWPYILIVVGALDAWISVRLLQRLPAPRVKR